jgi:hypothetical protein
MTMACTVSTVNQNPTNGVGGFLASIELGAEHLVLSSLAMKVESNFWKRRRTFESGRRLLRPAGQLLKAASNFQERSSDF